MSFKERVFDVVKTIPKGSTMSYTDVAQKAGSPKACRAVGNILAKNTDINIPCHRVIKSNGELGSYNNLQAPSKRDLLLSEGVIL